MCGRFLLTMPAQELQAYVENELECNIALPEYQVSYNIAPSQRILALQHNNAQLTQWGLTPSWSEKPIINARAESLAQKLTFHKLLESSRCLIPANGYFEWSNKQPFVFRAQKLFFAGLISNEQCVIITTAARDDLKQYHDRMPAMLSVNEQKSWLKKSTTSQEALTLLTPSNQPLDIYPISTRVNSPKNNSPKILDKVSLSVQQSLQ